MSGGAEESTAVFQSLPDLLWREADARTRWSLTFLEGAGDGRRIELEPFRRQVAALARHLLGITAPGEPVLLLYPPGIDFLVGFMACLAANRPAVPINPPRRNRLIERVDGIIADVGARVALTTAAMLADQAWWREGDLPLARLDWQETDGIVAAAPAWDGAAPAPLGEDDVAYIQYTSGSTSEPKGVVVSHGNLISTMRGMGETWRIGPDSVMVTWLPAFHDLGLIFGLLQPLYAGCATVAMAPARFLQTPSRWLEAITRHRGTHTAAPSFAYELCLRRIPDEQLGEFDLSSLRVAMNAAEPIDPSVMAAFDARFAGCGWSPTTMSPGFGLAEATLGVTGNGVGLAPVVRHLDVHALEAESRAVPVADGTPGGRTLVGCGRPFRDVEIAIADPATGDRLADGAVGEVWVAGPMIAGGYRNNPAATAEAYGARLSGGEPRWMRTGDLGFIADGELFITGRFKDMIIIRGVNYYPQDFERAAFRSHPALRPECGAAFSMPARAGGGERLAVVLEVERVHRRDDPTPIVAAIRDALWQGFDVAPEIVVLIEPGAVLRTSSGKIRRRATREAWLGGSLPVISTWEQPSAENSAAPAGNAAPAAPDMATLRRWLIEWLAEQTGVPADRIDPDESFATYGLDSVAATELALDLGEKLDRELPETLVWDHATPNRLLAHLATLAAPAASPQPTVAAAGSTGRDVDELLSLLEQEQRGAGG